MSNRLPGSTGKLTLGSVEPGPGLGKSRQKTGAGRGKGKKGKQNGERNEPWSQERTLVNLIQNTKSTRLVRGEQGSKRVKLNINKDNKSYWSFANKSDGQRDVLILGI